MPLLCFAPAVQRGSQVLLKALETVTDHPLVLNLWGFPIRRPDATVLRVLLENRLSGASFDAKPLRILTRCARLWKRLEQTTTHSASRDSAPVDTL